MPIQLEVLSGPDKGRIFPLTSESALAIGRGAQSHTRLVDPAVSRIHCEVQLHGNTAVVTDARSVSGTFVNGTRITTQTLRPGDIIRIGDTQLRLDHDVAEEKTVMPGEPPAKPAAGKPLGEIVF